MGAGAFESERLECSLSTRRSIGISWKLWSLPTRPLRLPAVAAPDEVRRFLFAAGLPGEVHMVSSSAELQRSGWKYLSLHNSPSRLSRSYACRALAVEDVRPHVDENRSMMQRGRAVGALRARSRRGSFALACFGLRQTSSIAIDEESEWSRVDRRRRVDDAF